MREFIPEKQIDQLLLWSVRHMVDNQLANFNTNEPAPADLIERVAKWYMVNVQHAVRFSDEAIKALTKKDEKIAEATSKISQLEKKLSSSLNAGSKLSWKQRFRGIV